mgnify:CR=1 FL=1
MYEGGIRVPMIAYWKGKIIAGSKSDLISAFWDMLPTFAEIAKTEAPEQIDGLSILPTLLGNKQKEHEYLFWDYPEYGGQQAVRMGKWKGIRNNIFKGNKKIELYN